jgi:TorA maturation chaperone TorD
MQAWEDGDPDEAKELLDRQRAFLMQHVLAWAPAFCESLDAHAGHPFYAAVARLTAGACTGAVAQPCT